MVVSLRREVVSLPVVLVQCKGDCNNENGSVFFFPSPEKSSRSSHPTTFRWILASAHLIQMNDSVPGHGKLKAVDEEIQ